MIQDRKKKEKIIMIKGGERVFNVWLIAWIVIKKGMTNIILVWIKIA
jgi:hypothetical protein